MDLGGQREGAMPRRTFGRRTFLRGVGATGAAIALTESGAGVAAASTDLRLAPVYRLSTRGMVVCSACKGTGAHKYFRKFRFANHGRAHKGCNCRVVMQRIPRRLWKQYFVAPGGALRREWDDRW